MPTTAVAFPYSYVDNLRLDVAVPVYHASSKPLEKVVLPSGEAYERRVLDIADDHSWDQIDVDVSFTVNEEQLAIIAAAAVDIVAETRAFVGVRCSASKLRQAFSLSYDGTNTWSGKVTLARQDLRGVVELVPEIVRTVPDSKQRVPGATFTAAILAAGEGVDIVLDRFARDYKGPIQFRWKDFRTEAGWVGSRPNDVYFADLGSVPVLYLNLRWKSLQAILNSTARMGIQAALRDSYAVAIAQPVWLQMLWSAAASVHRDEENDVFVAASGWRGSLAKVIAKKIYPDLHELQAFAAITGALKDAESSAALAGKLASIAHDSSKAGTLLDKAAKVFQREDDK